MANSYTLIAGSGTPVSSAGTPTAPSDVTITGISVIDGTPTDTGVPSKLITVTYAPPNPIGVFAGVWAYVDHPDSSLGSFATDGTVAADGNTAATGVFQPDLIRFFAYDANNLQLQFALPAPARNEHWRVYLISGSASNMKKPVQYGQAGASPSLQFLATVPPTQGSGREYAPLITGLEITPTLPSGWTANPNIGVADSGSQFFQFAIDWTWPTTDQNYQSLGGADVILDDGITKRLLASASNPNTPQYQSDPIPVPPGTTAYRVWVRSFDTTGQDNVIVPGVTPSVTFSITRKQGAAGVEWTALVSGLSVTATPYAAADGTQLLQIQTTSTAPTGNGPNGIDPTFGGVEIVVKRPSGTKYSAGSARPTTGQLITEFWIANPPASEAWTVYAVSVDSQNNKNTIVDGTTPSVNVTVGSSSGTLNIARAASANFSSEFQIVGSVFKIGTLDASVVKTGQLQVGGGGGKVSEVKIFDTLGALIGWIGDDSLNSGYVGAWFKQLRIGGSSPAAAIITADSSGNVTINGSTFVLNSNSTTTTINNAIDATYGNYSLKSLDNVNLNYSVTTPNSFVVFNSAGVAAGALRFTTRGRLTLTDPVGGIAAIALDPLSAGMAIFNNASGGSVQISNTATISVNGNQVVASRKTGWTPWTGTATRTSFATSTATLQNVAEALKALIDDLHATTAGHGLIG